MEASSSHLFFPILKYVLNSIIKISPAISLQTAFFFKCLGLCRLCSIVVVVIFNGDNFHGLFMDSIKLSWALNFAFEL